MIDDTSPSGQIRHASERAGAGSHVDMFAAIAVGFGVAAAVAWVIAILLAVRDWHTAALIPAELFAVTAAAMLTVFTGLFAVSAGIRRYVRHLVDEDVTVACRKLDRLAELIVSLLPPAAPQPPPVPAANGVDISEGLRGYLAGQLDRYDWPDNT